MGDRSDVRCSCGRERKTYAVFGCQSCDIPRLERGIGEVGSEVRRLWEAFSPVLDWYEGDGDRSLAAMLSDAVTDLQAGRKEVLRLRAIVAKLPVTADGVPVVPGMVLYCPSRTHGGHEDISVCYAWEKRDMSSIPLPVYMAEKMCYSTREAAEAAGERGSDA